jgi:hypothetical protein
VVKARRPSLRGGDLPRSRDHAVRRLRQDLENHSWPRTQMSLLVSLTGGAGLLASFLLLHAGMDSMALRYPVALAVAYGVFLLLLWLWLRTKADDWTDVPDAGIDLPLPTSGGSPAWTSGGGGQFGGGGASGHFDAPMPLQALSPGPSPSVGSSVSEGVTDGLADSLGSVSDVADADELVIPLLVVALAVGLALSSLYVIYSAPTLFAELLLDGALAATLYRRLRGIETRHWVSTALRRTVLPFAITAVFLSAVGWGLQSYAPGARSLGDAIHHTTAPQ